ncbi:MAG: ATP-binding protein [Ferruginibacter sp.]
MRKNNIEVLLLSEVEKLMLENKLLQKQLIEAKSAIEAIKEKSIDAVVITGKKGLKVYTETSADKIYRILIEKMHEGAVIVSKEGNIIYCNSCFSEKVNLDLQKIIGTKFSNYICGPFSMHFDEVLAAGTMTTLKESIYMCVHEAKSIPVLLSANTFTMDDNFVWSIVLTDLSGQFKDREELKSKSILLEQKNDELESANKDLTTFSYISSHDLQEPLRKIQNFVKCIQSDEERNLSTSGKNYLGRLEVTAIRMQALLEDLLTYSQVKLNSEKFEKINLSVILDEVLIDFADIIKEKSAIIEAHNLTQVSIIKFQFRQVLQNLLSNSLKFSKQGTAPIIKIKTEIINMNLNKEGHLHPKESYCHITYSDNGIGFDPQYSLRIFDVFQRLHSKEEYNGTGMGLAICKRIIENHKGVIIASGKLNKGATFDIYIPVNTTQ